MNPDFARVSALVIAAAREELLPRFTRAVGRSKADGSLVTEADLAMQRRLQEELAAAWPDYPLLGEEMATQEQQRLLAGTKDGLWCLDPLDGTSNYAYGIPFFAVSLAFLRQGEVAWGLVYDPVRDECFTASRGEGACLNGRPLSAPMPAPSLHSAIALVDLKRLPRGLAKRLAVEMPFRSQRNFGSAALDWAWIAAGRGHVYLHGRQKLWDYAAGGVILREAGGYSLSLEGAPLIGDTLHPCSVVAARDDRLFREWLAWLGVAPKETTVNL